MFRQVLIATLVVTAVLGATANATAQQRGKAAATSVGKTAAALINLNTATIEQLDTLPRVGPKVAARIIEYRQKNNGFKRIEDVMNVKGIGEKMFLRIKDRITVSPARSGGSGR